MSPVEIAAEVLNVEPARIASCERIKHGLTNQSWLVRAGADALVVRISNDDAALDIDRNSEARILAAVAAAGLGPEVLRCEPSRQLLVTRYLGETWRETDAILPANTAKLAAWIRGLHELPAPAGVRHVDLVASIESYLTTLSARGRGGDLLRPSLRSRGIEVAQTLRRGSIACLCHNDIHHLNVVECGSLLRLIDWEYAGLGAPAFDLASVCVYHRYDQRQREQLLSAYLSQPGDDAAKQLELACWLFEYIGELWLAVRES